MSINIVEMIRQQARVRPASPAIISHDKVITFGQLSVAVSIAANHLRRHGVLPAQVVGVSMGQNPLHVIILLGLAQLGAISLPLHPAVPVERRILSARRFGAVCIVSGRNEMALPGLSFVSFAGLSFDGVSVLPSDETHPVNFDTPFRIAVSSGTSGDPKGVMLSHGLMTLRTWQADHGLTALSRTLPMDLNFIVGIRPAFSALAKGAALVIPVSSGAESLLHTLVSHAVTHVYLSPAQARGLVETLATDGIRCPNLICLRIGGGPLPAETLREVKQKITPNVYVSYGSTESGLVSYATPEILDQHPSCVGRVTSWAKIEVVREDNHNEQLPPGSIGVLRIRSDHQASGYYLDGDRTEKHFRDGWFYPGDLGGYDEDGLLYIEGRVDDQLNVGGLKVNPEDIDAALAAHPDVVEAAAFVLAREEGHEVLAAAIVLRTAGRFDEVPAYAAAKLGLLAPLQYFIVPSLPRTITGKLQRAELATRLRSEISR